MPEQEFLVFIEEDDDEEYDDRIVLDVASPRANQVGEVDVHPEIEVEIQNTASPVATGGLAATIFGALMGIAAVVTFTVTYPNYWFDASGLRTSEPVIWFNALFAVLAGAGLVIGTFLTTYGQRLRAVGRLRALHVTERTGARPRVNVRE